jgi:prevent-host-death family protein
MKSPKRRRPGATGKRKTLAASEFKAHCLRVLDEVAAGQEVVITKHGTEVALLSPMVRRGGSSRGRWRGLVEVKADIVHADWSGHFEAASTE